MTSWIVLFHTNFLPEFDTFQAEVQDELLTKVKLLQALGPTLKRPHADTLKGSKHKKSGGSSDQFYRQLITKADERFDEHLRVMRQKKDET